MSTRERWAAWLEKRGGTFKNSVTKRTDVLIVGDEPGRDKIEKAKRYGIPTLHWQMFVALGLAEERGEFQLEHVDAETIASLSLIMASILEDFYARHLRTGSERHRLSFEHGQLALESLLQSAYGPSRGPASP